MELAGRNTQQHSFAVRQELAGNPPLAAPFKQDHNDLHRSSLHACTSSRRERTAASASGQFDEEPGMFDRGSIWDLLTCRSREHRDRNVPAMRS